MAGRAGAIAIYAGVGVLRGGPFAQAIGLAIVGFSAVRWFFFRPVAPWVAITVIALDVLVVCGLVAHSEYFDIDTAHQQRKSAAAPQQPRPNRRPHPPRRALVGADSPRAQEVRIPAHTQADVFAGPLECSYVLDGTWQTHQRLELENDLIAAYVLTTDSVPPGQFIGQAGTGPTSRAAPGLGVVRCH